MSENANYSLPQQPPWNLKVLTWKSSFGSAPETWNGFLKDFLRDALVCSYKPLQSQYAREYQRAGNFLKLVFSQQGKNRRPLWMVVGLGRGDCPLLTPWDTCSGSGRMKFSLCTLHAEQSVPVHTNSSTAVLLSGKKIMERWKYLFFCSFFPHNLGLICQNEIKINQGKSQTWKSCGESRAIFVLSVAPTHTEAAC